VTLAPGLCARGGKRVQRRVELLCNYLKAERAQRCNEKELARAVRLGFELPRDFGDCTKDFSHQRATAGQSESRSPKMFGCCARGERSVLSAGRSTDLQSTLIFARLSFSGRVQLKRSNRPV
jgi:hypothetical protein